MSLISEALRKARQDGGGGAGRDARLPAAFKQPPRGGRPSALMVAVVAILAALLGAGGVWMAVHQSVRHGESRTNVAAAGTAGVAPGKPVEPAQQGPHGGPNITESASPAGTPVPSRTAAGTEDLPIPTRSASDEARNVKLGPPARRREPGRKTPPTEYAAVEEGVRRKPGEPARQSAPAGDRGASRAKGSGRPGRREIVGEGTVDGVKLSLDYLVYRSTDPFAQINGMEVHVGSDVSGFKVLAIDENLVRLQGSGGPVILRVR